MKKPDGGFAFPSWDGTLLARSSHLSLGGKAGEVHPSTVLEATPPSGGMSLRDYFAGQALATAFSIWDSGYAGDGGLPHDMAGAEHIATTAYQIADAMIAAREAE